MDHRRSESHLHTPVDSHANHLSFHKVMTEAPPKGRAAGPAPVAPGAPVETAPKPVPPTSAPPVESTPSPKPTPPGNPVEGGPKPTPPGNPVEGGPKPTPPGNPVEGGPKPTPPGNPVEGGPKPTPPGNPVEGGPKPTPPGNPVEGGPKPTPPGNPVEGGPKPKPPGNPVEGNPPPNNPTFHNPFRSGPADLSLQPLPPLHPHPRTPDNPVPDKPVPNKPVTEVPPPAAVVPPLKIVVPPAPQEQVPPVVAPPAPGKYVVPPLALVPKTEHPHVDVTPPPVHVKIPTNVFTGKDGIHPGSGTDRSYINQFTRGENNAPHKDRLVSAQLGVTGPDGKNHPWKVDIDPVGTGKDMGLKKHQTEMVAPHNLHDVGEWKYSDPAKTGKTIIAGHVSVRGVPGPMYELNKLGVHNGVPDKVTLETADGKHTTYQFSGRELVKDPSDQKVWNRVFAPGDPKHKELELITCAGPIDSHGAHKWRLVDYLTEVKPNDGTKSHKAAPAAAGDAAAHASPAGHISAPESSQPTVPKAPIDKVSANAPASVVPDAPATPKVAAVKDSAPAAPPVSAPSDALPAAAGASSDTSKVQSSAGGAVKGEVPTVAPESAVSPPVKVGGSTSSLETAVINSPGSAPQQRIVFNNVLNKPHGAFTGATLDFGGGDGKIGYVSTGPNFTFVNTERDLVRGNLRAGFGTGHDVQATDFSSRGLDKLTLSSQFDATHRLGGISSPLRDTSIYGAAAFSLGSRGNESVFEAGLEQNNGSFFSHIGYQRAQDHGAAPGSYLTLGTTWLSGNHGKYSVGLDAQLPVGGSGQSRGSNVELKFGVKF